MTKEDAGRDELFWNTTLAPDDVTRLFEPKALTGFERWDAAAVAAGAPKPVGEIGDDDNLLIKGNNLLALHSLKQRYAGQVKLIYIDPPYNTGDDGFRYNDRFNQSSWLTFIRDRLYAAKQLLNSGGAIAVSIDANELSYLQVLMDEVFGRSNLTALITVKRASITGHKVINPGVVNVSEYVVIYAKDKAQWKPNRVYRARERDARYNGFINNVDDDRSNWEFTTLLDAFAKSHGVQKSKLKKHLGDSYANDLDRFVIHNARQVYQLATIDLDASGEAARILADRSLAEVDKVFVLERKGLSDIYIVNGKRILFYEDRIIEVDGVRQPGEAVSDIWDDVLPNDLHNEGGVKFKKGKKPEKLLYRILELASGKGDLVLDFFLGSGSSASVAHKSGRRWIGVEQMDYGDQSAAKRLRGVIAGDATGISKQVGWTDGGSFIYAELAEANESLGRSIRNAADSDALDIAIADMKATGYWHYKVDQGRLDRDAFAELPLDKRKQVLLDSLDANHLYVNYGDIADEAYGVSDEDIRVNRAFYGDAA